MRDSLAIVTTPPTAPLPHYLAPVLAAPLACALAHVWHAGWPLEQGAQGPPGGGTQGPAEVAAAVVRAGGVGRMSLEELKGVLQGAGVLEGGAGQPVVGVGVQTGVGHDAHASAHALTVPLTVDHRRRGATVGPVGGMLLWGGPASRQGPSAVAAALLCVLPGWCGVWFLVLFVASLQ